MKFEAIVRFFKHIAEREVSHGIENAFKFENVLFSCRKRSLIPAQYKDLGTKPDADNGTFCHWHQLDEGGLWQGCLYREIGYWRRCQREQQC